MEAILQELRNAFVVSDDTSMCEKICSHCSEFMAEDLKTSVGTAECVPEFIAQDPLPLPHIDQSKKSALTLALEKTRLDGKSVNKFNDFAIFDGRLANGKSGCLPKNQSASRLRPFVIWFWRIPGLPKISLSVQPTSSCTVRDLVGLSLWQHFNENPLATVAFNSESCHLEKDAASIIRKIDVYMYDTQDDVDDFPPINFSDSIYKYDFDALALVENVAVAPPPHEVIAEPLVYVTVHLAQGISLVRFPTSATLERVLNEAINRRKLRQHEGYAYRLEEWIDPDKQSHQIVERRPLDLSMTLGEYTKNNARPHFVLIREHSRYDPVVGDNDRGMQVSGLGDSSFASSSASSNDAMTRNLPLRKYRATHLRGPTSRDVQLTISREKLEVQAFRLPRVFRGGYKSLTVPMSHVVDCSFCSAANTPGDFSEKPLSKVQFIIHYLPPLTGQQSGGTGIVPLSTLRVELDVASEEKTRRFSLEDIASLVFEAQWTSARAICHQVNSIFSCCPSRIRDVYVNLRLSASKR